MKHCDCSCYQLLSHCYVVATSSVGQARTLLTTVASHPSEQPRVEDETWYQLSQLVLNDRLLSAVEQMQQECWTIPEARYELMGDVIIGGWVDNLQMKIGLLKKLQAQTAAEMDALLPSIIDKAFKGEL